MNIKKLILCILILGFTGTIFSQDSKIKGISFVASSSPIDQNDVKPVISVNANWVTLMPYGYVGKDGQVKFNSKWQWWGETSAGLNKTIELCKAAGLKIMIKPQIWMMNAYTGDYTLEKSSDWERFEKSYANFVLTFLESAIKYDIPLFCIGTEWREFVAQRPEFWDGLITIIRDKYEGELVYASNWDDYKKVPFWNKLDYIGVDGYFPLSYSTDPTLKELELGWEVHKKELKTLSEQHNKKVIFTEVGYRSMVGSTIKPWEHGTGGEYSAKIQDNAYKALFNSLWNESWFHGIFIWKWYHDHERQGGKGDLDFTPQNKPAEKTIRDFWAEKS